MATGLSITPELHDSTDTAPRHQGVLEGFGAWLPRKTTDSWLPNTHSLVHSRFSAVRLRGKQYRRCHSHAQWLSRGYGADHDGICCRMMSLRKELGELHRVRRVLSDTLKGCSDCLAGIERFSKPFFLSSLGTSAPSARGQQAAILLIPGLIFELQVHDD